MSYVIVTTDTSGLVANLIGPFDSDGKAVEYMEDNEVYLTDLEVNLVKADSRIDAETVESVVMFMNAPDEMWKVIS